MKQRDYTNYKVDSNGCWIWQFNDMIQHRYGPYRDFYLKYNGFIPLGKVIMHTCDNKHCVNPNHLVLGSHIGNMQDAGGAGQTKKLLAGIIKEKHFKNIHMLLKRRVEIEQVMNM